MSVCALFDDVLEGTVKGLRLRYEYCRIIGSAPYLGFFQNVWVSPRRLLDDAVLRGAGAGMPPAHWLSRSRIYVVVLKCIDGGVIRI